MTSKKPKSVPVVESSPYSFWDIVLGSLACLLVMSVPFFPDEKLTRLKMEVLESGLFFLLLMIGLRFFLTGRAPGRRRIVVPLAVAAWVGVQFFLYAIAPEKSLAAGEIRRVVLGAAAFVAFSFLGLKETWQRRFLFSWAISGGILALYGILQYWGGVGFLMVPQMDRIMGTYGNPIFFAAFLLPTLFVSAAAFSCRGAGTPRFLVLLSFWLQLAALYLTQTRAAWIGLGSALVLSALLKYGFRRIPLWWIVVAIFGSGFFLKQTSGVWERDQGHLLIWRDTLRIWSDHPITGVGLGAFHTNFPAYAQPDLKAKWPKDQFIVNYAHNEFLQTLAEGGILGGASFVAMIAVFFFGWRRDLRSEKGKHDSVAFYLGLGVAALLIQNLFSVDMRFGISFASVFMLMGFLVAREIPDEEKWSVPVGFLNPLPVRLLSSGLWIAAMGGLWPVLVRPYLAQKEVKSTPSFFDQRLLDPAKSIQDLELLARQYPTEPVVLEKLAYVYAKEIKGADKIINADMVAKAVATYKKLIDVDPKRVSAYNNLANTYYTVGRVDDAITTWKKALEVNPDFIDVHLNLGKILYTRGDLKESAAHFEKVLKLDPGNAEAIVYMKRMVE